MSSIKSRKARNRRGIRSVLMHKGERTSIDIIINPHYGIKVQEDANGEVAVQLVTTHHGVELSANRVKDELEQAIRVLRDDPQFRRVD